MTLCFPAYRNDPDRKHDVLARVEGFNWANCTRFEGWLRANAAPNQATYSALHDMTGYPADLILLAETILEHLPADRRGRFVTAVFDSPDTGADLAPVSEQVLGALARELAPGAWPLVGRSLAVKGYPAALEAIVAQAKGPDAATAWMTCADLVIEVLAGATRPGRSA